MKDFSNNYAFLQNLTQPMRFYYILQLSEKTTKNKETREGQSLQK